jgi:cytoskeletal protein CcmA (bactofilin family)
MSKTEYKKVTLNFTSLVAAGTTMKGDYTGKANLLVEGLITGDVKVKGAVMVAEGGAVDGRIETDYAIVAGNVGGDVIASKGAEVKPTGNVAGNVFARELLIAPKGKVGGDIGAAKKQIATYVAEINVKGDAPEK